VAKRTRARHRVMTMHCILAGKAVKTREIEALSEIPRTVPPPPTGYAYEWPPGDAMNEWLNVVLDVEMRDQVVRWFDEMDETVSSADLRAAIEDPGGFAMFSYSVRRDAGPLLDLLRTPSERAHKIRLVRGATRRPNHRPPKPKEQRRGDSFTWRADVDSRRLRDLLRERYPGRRGLATAADEIAAARWGIQPNTLANLKNRPSNDRRRLAPPKTT
jgi:hypothetical protein